jgi:hypothetical protein
MTLESVLVGALVQAVSMELGSIVPAAIAPAPAAEVSEPAAGVVADVLPVAVVSVPAAVDPAAFVPVVDPAAAVSVLVVEPAAAPVLSVAPAAAVPPMEPLDIAASWCPAQYPWRKAVWDALSIAVRSEQSMPGPGDVPEVDCAMDIPTPQSNAAVDSATSLYFIEDLL